MANELQASVFDPTRDGHIVANFTCGDEPWAVAASRWITTSEVKDSMSRGTTVWLYHDGPDFVGYGSLGKTTWLQFPQTELSVIPSLAIITGQQQKPVGAPKEGRYSSQLVRHLVTQAEQSNTDFLVLYVHEKNTGAIKLYEYFGFLKMKKTKKLTLNGATHIYYRMYLRLKNPPTATAPPEVAAKPGPDSETRT